MITIEEYSKQVAIPTETLLGKSRKFPVTIVREVYWLYLRKNGFSYAGIAAIFSRSQHSTVSSGIQNAKNLIETGEKRALSLINILHIRRDEIFNTNARYFR
jgi:chromosomal replication initiation ATPase DnaA